MHWTLSLLLLIASLVGGARAHAQASAIDDARLASVRSRLEQARDAASTAGLPAEWLDAKAAEGLSKRVPPPRIAMAVEALLGHMRAADAMLRGLRERASGDQRRRALRALVDAQAAGASREALGSLVREVGQGERRAHAVVALAAAAVAELGERGFEGGVALQAVGTTWRRGGARAIPGLLRAAANIQDRDPSVRHRALQGAAERQGRALGHDRGQGQGRGRGSPAGRMR